MIVQKKVKIPQAKGPTIKIKGTFVPMPDQDPT